MNPSVEFQFINHVFNKLAEQNYFPDGFRYENTKPRRRRNFHTKKQGCKIIDSLFDSTVSSPSLPKRKVINNSVDMMDSLADGLLQYEY